ncbi:MAG: TIGR04150 pseudo-rSAM protein [Phycisphaerae bacterium]|nr:TIGR04150 pseudo-rSAM protein [Phycisphaerae bacterium]
MPESGRSQWFYLHPHVHTCAQGASGLLYDPLTGHTLEYTNETAITELVASLDGPDNLRVVDYADVSVTQPAVADFVDRVRALHMGGLIDKKHSTGKPIQMTPRARVQRDPRKDTQDADIMLGEAVMGYVKEVTIHVNRVCDLDCALCTSAYKQFRCCTRIEGGNEELDLATIRHLLAELASSGTMQVNMIGGDVFSYSRFEELIKLVAASRFYATLHTHYLNLPETAATLEILDARRWTMELLVPMPVDRARLAEALRMLRAAGLPYVVHLVVETDDDLAEAEGLIDALGLVDFAVRPHFNGQNLAFFEENVFFTKDDVVAARPSPQDLYASSRTNRLDFGRLVVLSTGEVFANPNTPKLGDLASTSVHKMLCHEVRRGESWFRTRSCVKPCRNCVFQCMCPPISNYEHAIGRNNLCLAPPREVGE